MTTRTEQELTWSTGQGAYLARCRCGGTHTVWQYGRPWVVNKCATCGLPPTRPDERRWLTEATHRGHPVALRL